MVNINLNMNHSMLVKKKNKRYKKINGRSSDFIDIINEIKSFELEPIILKLYENLSEDESLVKETELINVIGRIDLGTGFLINKTSGGQGTSGYEHLEETKQKISEKNKGKVISEETKNKLSKSHIGKYHSEKTKELISKKQRKNFQEIKKEFEKRGYILLTEEKDYENAQDTKLKYTCPKGHESSIIWNSFQQRHSCSICYDESCSEMKGEKSTHHKLTEEQIIQIKLLLKEGILTQQEVANMFGVNRTIISKIKTGKSWSYIKI